MEMDTEMETKTRKGNVSEKENVHFEKYKFGNVYICVLNIVGRVGPRVAIFAIIEHKPKSNQRFYFCIFILNRFYLYYKYV